MRSFYRAAIAIFRHIGRQASDFNSEKIMYSVQRSVTCDCERQRKPAKVKPTKASV